MQSGREVASDLDEAPAHRSPTVVFLMLWFSTGAFPVVLRWSSPEVNADYNDAMYLNSLHNLSWMYIICLTLAVKFSHDTS